MFLLQDPILFDTLQCDNIIVNINWKNILVELFINTFAQLYCDIDLYSYKSVNFEILAMWLFIFL